MGPEMCDILDYFPPVMELIKLGGFFNFIPEPTVRNMWIHLALWTR
jgi:hypothetical protein